MTEQNLDKFDLATFLANAGFGRKIVRLKAKEAFFLQGHSTGSIFYLQSGRAKLNVFSTNGKEATVMLLGMGDFLGEESLAAAPAVHTSTATAITGCVALKITKEEMSRVIREEHTFSDMFVRFLLSRNVRTQADLVDQLFNNSEKRLARILLLMADYGEPGVSVAVIPHVTQETLAGMTGTTRSRISFFMNRFRKLGFIEYNGHIKVNKSLLNVVLHD